ncbi:hypothetical protein [Chitinophaga silvisoli]|uniref:Uncharacterized protein n=1 Tax=Chitinophaga silvisoli TaxID=2291814 RepID=A0A3E1NUL1_9BACT|nr:hypothetical protein [Chitinophaga silvisoli]RFM31610.1 hypothetical protein DXN04_28260 [Chitinophaga silvisoli]
MKCFIDTAKVESLRHAIAPHLLPNEPEPSFFISISIPFRVKYAFNPYSLKPQTSSEAERILFGIWVGMYGLAVLYADARAGIGLKRAFSQHFPPDNYGINRKKVLYLNCDGPDIRPMLANAGSTY